MAGAQRKCPSCQKLINREAKFCNFCGQKQAPLNAAPPDLTDKNFLSAAELETLKNNLAEQPAPTIAKFLEHANKYLRQAALEIFWQKSSAAEKKQLLQARSSDTEFAVGLLDLQPDWAELFAGFWTRASEDPWLVRKYLAWAKRRGYALPLDAAQYLESTADRHLRRLAGQLVKK
ncbi:MAG: zinc ribbon domain-containing protein [Candidatus Margulisbacteria bacterium]|jgi:hypothetical protein|nr:zinc ribbon domain-containing protein [Candidatus Margulisiibacteriota bacterium]